jgi:hypothetical protein
MDVTTSRAVKTVRITKLPCNLTHTQFYIRFCCPFSFTLSASDCCLLEIFIQSLAEIQLLVTRNIARNRIKPFSASSQSYSKCRREKNNMSRTRGKEVEWEQENGKFISPNTLFYPHSLAPPPTRRYRKLLLQYSCGSCYNSDGRDMPEFSKEIFHNE